MYSVFAFSILAIAHTATAADDPYEKEYTKAAGSWTVTAMTMNGHEFVPEAFKGMTIILAKNKVTAKHDGEVIADGVYKIVAVKGKKVEFDLTMGAGPDKGKTFPCLNEWVDDDTLRTSIAQPDAKRPTGYNPEKDDRRAHFVIKREKKK
jgi:uncharacterized protein (TIGR03067 family)